LAFDEPLAISSLVEGLCSKSQLIKQNYLRINNAQTHKHTNTQILSKLCILATFLLLTIQVSLIPIAYADGTETIEISGTRLGFSTGPWTVSCEGMGCKNAADSIQSEIDTMLRNAAAEYIEQSEAQELFCAELSGERPEHCQSMFGGDMFWPHSGDSSALWNIPSATNGCGTGSSLEWAASKYAEGSGGFTGNLNEPVTGYSFESACNAHDLCYGASSGQVGCDSTFHNTLTDICNANYECEAFADAYGSAVKIFGEEPYEKAGKTQQCREFKNDMEENCSDVSGISGT